MKYSKYRKKKNYYIVGVMSGTSMDGIDISLIKTDGVRNYQHINSKFYNFKRSTQILISELSYNFDKNKYALSKVYQCERSISIDIIRGIRDFKSRNKKYRIDLVSIHGQTIFHSSKLKCSIQLCDSKLVKQFIKIPIVCNFRQKDLFYGGEGAPLVPIFHKLLLVKSKTPLPSYFINIGGISNITYLSKSDGLIAYDVGPGMCLLDKYVKMKKKLDYDVDGKYSNKGKIKLNIVKKLLGDKFFYKAQPKSLDINYFSLESFMSLEFYDACASIAAFTVYSIIREINKRKFERIILSGGGAKNKFITSLLKNEYGSKFALADSIGIDLNFIESQAFGYLGARRLKKLPISFPKTTGVSKPQVGGIIS